VALVAGASNQLPTVGFSAPNDCDKKKVDDPPLGVQNIMCRAPNNVGVLECHHIARTTCEIMYACGSGDRPPFKECPKLGYDVPQKRTP